MYWRIVTVIVLAAVFAGALIWIDQQVKSQPEAQAYRWMVTVRPVNGSETTHQISERSTSDERMRQLISAIQPLFASAKPGDVDMFQGSLLVADQPTSTRLPGAKINDVTITPVSTWQHRIGPFYVFSGLHGDGRMGVRLDPSPRGTETTVRDGYSPDLMQSICQEITEMMEMIEEASVK